MKLFISWSQDISRQIAQEFREWLPLVNQTIDPFMSEEDTDKGAHWSATIRRELEQSAFGIVILTPENIESTWLHFEAGAIAKSVEEGRLVPILFGLKHSDVQQPLSMFQAALYEKDDIFRVVKSMNGATGSNAREEKHLSTVFDSVWFKLDSAIQPKLQKLRSTPPRHEQKQLEHDRILEELLLLGRQQSRLLSNPAGLVGEEILALLLRLTHEPDGTALRLVHRERDLVLALCGRWGKLEYELHGYLHVLDPKERRQAREMIERFSTYVKELQAVLTGTATPQSIVQAFGSGASNIDRQP
ncbi:MULTISPECIES: toll/interleukin-1 receptor domain-containing protein [unclassified Bradyrhizobium]|uniref:toll/interleukin-1 receptor domain-containing protein n=1 Tax=unclassified Bradyrhizobium TaxID=2631580 RepID=UPI001CD6FF2A|nr:MULTISPECIES: toll/interleukin-1 receptor domain-containing protein [unclassified Bradyrhizobium]MCA1498286.1 toll/interleukin-1 receptor domain-containing protein [Bradyrhizobium sp. NBAIM14]MCA1531827.1 toll/interleukin-1 receptor domain-containing protein [Bradyrhizobium sp. NBAIM03]